MIRYNAISIALAVFFGSLTIYLVRRQSLGIYQTLIWTCSALALVLAGVFPQFVDWIGHHLGISYPPVLLIVVTLCLIVVKLLTMDIERTAHETKLRILTQRMAAYEAELCKFHSAAFSEAEKKESASTVKS